MDTFNWNKFAELVCQKEGGKLNLSIAQVKEVIRIVACFAFSRPEFCNYLMNYGRKCTEKEITALEKKALKKTTRKKPGKSKP